LTGVGRSDGLLIASDVARFCQVDLKTVHNWADKGKIVCFRTPGRHLRFRAPEVLTFLRTFGYPIPPDLTAAAIGAPERHALVAFLRAVRVDSPSDAAAAGAALRAGAIGCRARGVACVAFQNWAFTLGAVGAETRWKYTLRAEWIGVEDLIIDPDWRDMGDVADAAGAPIDPIEPQSAGPGREPPPVVWSWFEPDREAVTRRGGA